MKTLFPFFLFIVSLAVNGQDNIIEKAQDKLRNQGIKPVDATPQQWAEVLQEIGKTERANENLIVCTDEFENKATLYFTNGKLTSYEHYFSDKYPKNVPKPLLSTPKNRRFSDKSPLAKANMPILDTKSDNSKITIAKPDSTHHSNMPVKKD